MNYKKYLRSDFVNKALLIPTMLIGFPLFVLALPHICFALYLLLLLNRKYYKLRLSPIVKEARLFYDVNIIDNDFLTFRKDNKFTSIPMPGKISELKKVAEKFKNKVGCIDCPEFLNNRDDLNIINKIKLEKKHIFFYPLYKDKKFLSEIHLYDLSSLDDCELNSILSMKITNFQKAIIYSKYKNH